MLYVIFLSIGISAVAEVFFGRLGMDNSPLLVAQLCRYGCICIDTDLSLVTSPPAHEFLLRMYSVLVHCYLQLQLRKAFTGKQSFDVIPLSGKVPLHRPWYTRAIPSTLQPLLPPFCCSSHMKRGIQASEGLVWNIVALLSCFVLSFSRLE